MLTKTIKNIQKSIIYLFFFLNRSPKYCVELIMKIRLFIITIFFYQIINRILRKV